ncbi:hypothetical protein B0T26DRAFT_755724 [Lasiosphaeria miniovina]|uniref:Uncharacterized protein n=1 Tax=Lasiosphaeria miniovina TaxID=1954250 RepID=A0AA39ZYX8_9PEZI|nr:uncharacterized protein B0T26DRAFT_755724 [Lasiosphaeria miniovina]KAK0706198.1 hypothetical protein B0T26DRAFT_755724 [Lasiosphaeria miniovina]
MDFKILDSDNLQIALQGQLEDVQALSDSQKERPASPPMWRSSSTSRHHADLSALSQNLSARMNGLALNDAAEGGDAPKNQEASITDNELQLEDADMEDLDEYNSQAKITSPRTKVLSPMSQ